MRKVKWLSAMLAAAMLMAMLPATVFAAGNVSVYVGSTKLSEGTNEVGGGTAELNTEAATLILENVSVTDFVEIVSDSDFTVIVKGNTSIGTEQSRTNGSAVWCHDTLKLDVRIEEGASLSVYGAANGNGIYMADGSLSISGPGSLKGDAGSDGYPVLYAEGDINLQNIPDANISGYRGIFTPYGNIVINGCNVRINAEDVALFTQSYDEGNDSDIDSYISAYNSTINITSNTYDGAIYTGCSESVIENTKLTVNAPYGYSFYSNGNLVIRGDATDVQTVDDLGIYADNILTIEGGNVNAQSSNDTPLYGWKGVTISGGTVYAESKAESAIASNAGEIRLTGSDTKITAVSSGADAAVIRNVRDGGIYLDAAVTAESTTGQRAYEGRIRGAEAGTAAITLGENFNVEGAEIYTSLTEVKGSAVSYFIPAGGDGSEILSAVTTECDHVWGQPAWNWSEDHTKAEATFTCTRNASHTETLDAVITKEVTEASCTAEGKTVYTAAVTLDGQEYTDTVTVTIPMKAHTYENGKCTVCGTNDPASQTDDKTDKDKSEVKSGSPKTGDTANTGVWWMLLIASAAAAAVLLKAKRQK